MLRISTSQYNRLGIEPGTLGLLEECQYQQTTCIALPIIYMYVCVCITYYRCISINFFLKFFRSEYWKSVPRKFCDFCKCWITDNKPVSLILTYSFLHCLVFSSFCLALGIDKCFRFELMTKDNLVPFVMQDKRHAQILDFIL